ncbi:MAG: DUF6232 family protein [Woeseiaceae bacterium]|nr:DUF6232 family protein [Woeseiaceae bacterium]
MKTGQNRDFAGERTENESTSTSGVLFADDRFTVTREFVRHGPQTWPVSTITKVTDFKRPFGFVESIAIGTAFLIALIAIIQFTLIWIVIGLAIAVLCAKYVLNVFKNQYIVCIEFDTGDKEKILLSQQGVAFRLRNAIRAAL